MSSGTPATLIDAVINARNEPTAIRQYFHIKDFIAQKFQIALARAESPAERERLKNLFTVLTVLEEARP